MNLCGSARTPQTAGEEAGGSRLGGARAVSVSGLGGDVPAKLGRASAAEGVGESCAACSETGRTGACGQNYNCFVDRLGLWDRAAKPIEYLCDRQLEFVDYAELRIYQERDVDVEACCLEQGEARRAVKRWVEFQDGQRILVTTPSVLVGYRVQVYRAEGTTQWYTAVIISYNETTRALSTSPENASPAVLGGELAARRRCPRGVALALSRGTSQAAKKKKPDDAAGSVQGWSCRCARWGRVASSPIRKEGKLAACATRRVASPLPRSGGQAATHVACAPRRRVGRVAALCRS
ncbi:hypothetical protein IscW_ISCW018594 [Ixodes scapularis]|uniref:Uncharacterized protein n=1 Tax=Ixodes scapularis TaxID=6945 RepID=B7PM84_IXOSC|nr:hypothetical protein IscW_ISCW018594 [Ixodes scapularis]|eukprot:XP_002434884.1 hypothetical protein IscW_ISCW018594 [Ixodes scapularis]